MSSSQQPPIFPKPYPVPGNSWFDLPREIQNLWSQWSYGTPVADTDFRSIYRTGQAAFQITNTNRNTTISESTFLELPPEAKDIQRGVVTASSIIAAVTPGLYFRVGVKATLPRDFQCWSCGYFLPTAHPDLSKLQFLQSFRVYETYNPDDPCDQMRVRFEALFGDLGEHIGERLAVFLFQESFGQCVSAGNWTQEVQGI
jgi:hypothetical protein